MRPPLFHFLTTALLALLLTPESDARSRKPPADSGEPCVVLKPFVVKDLPITCFGMSLCILADPATRKVGRLFVLQVQPGSEAATKGLSRGTEILAADDHDVASLAARFEPDSEFNHLFMNRQAGDRITLKIVPTNGAQPQVVELTQSGRSADWRPWLPGSSD